MICRYTPMRLPCTARDSFDAWQADGTWQRLVDALRQHVRMV